MGYTVRGFGGMAIAVRRFLENFLPSGGQCPPSVGDGRWIKKEIVFSRDFLTTLLPRLTRVLSRLLLLSLIGGLLLAMPAPALGVTTAPPEAVAPPAPAQPDANDIPSDTVSRFVKAYIAVVKLIESRELGLQRAETDTESSQMQQEIQAAALDLIQANDLTLSDYWELLGLANSDPEFRDRVLAQIDEASF